MSPEQLIATCCNEKAMAVYEAKEEAARRAS